MLFVPPERKQEPSLGLLAFCALYRRRFLLLSYINLTSAIIFLSISGAFALLGPLVKSGVMRYNSLVIRYGRLAQLARASRLHREGRGFESLSAHQ
jgi:hypothetical protein